MTSENNDKQNIKCKQEEKKKTKIQAKINPTGNVIMSTCSVFHLNTAVYVISKTISSLFLFYLVSNVKNEYFMHSKITFRFRLKMFTKVPFRTNSEF